MSQSFDFDSELIFTNNYDLNVILNSDIQDKSNTDFQNSIQNEVDKILNVLSIYNGITTMSSFVEFNNKKYKMTVLKK